MAAKEKRIDRQTPTKSFVLPYERSLSAGAVEIYERTGRKVLEWQKKLLQDIMAVNPDGQWTHMTVGYSVPRRNGKTEDVYMRELWGLMHGEKIAHTAHRNSTSHSSFEAMKSLLEAMGLQDKEDFISNRALGNERIDLGEGRIQYRTRTGQGGLGEGFDLLVIDEAQEYTDTHQSALRYTITSSQNPQTIMLGTPPTAVSRGTVFQPFREKCLSGKAEDAMWAEWSIERKAADRSDRDLWYETNPSLGLIINERSIKGETADLEEVDFNIQRLGLWLAYSQSSAITEPEWTALKCKTMPTFTGRLFAGIKYGKDNRNVSLSVAVRTSDKKIFIETLDCRPIGQGNAWLVDFLRTADVEKVVIDGANGQSLLAEELKDAGLKKIAILPKVSEVIEANASFTQAISSETICHMGQPSLMQSATNCERRAIGSNGGFGYQSQIEGIDITLLDSCIFAFWACATAKEKKKQRISY